MEDTNMPQRAMYAVVARIAQDLTDTELNALCLAGLLGTNPIRVAGYEKAKTLFTESDGTRMHVLTLDTLVSIRNERLDGEEQS